MKYQIDITAWYINTSRIPQLLNIDDLVQYGSILDSLGNTLGALPHEAVNISIAKKVVEDWLRVNDVPSMGKLLTKERLPKDGQLFTIYHDFYGNGLLKYAPSSQEIPRNAIAQIHNKLKYNDNYRLRVFFHPGGLTSNSSWERLSGRSRMFVFAYIERMLDNEIHARPYIIGDLNNDFLAESLTKWNSSNYGEIHPSMIEQFSVISDQRRNEKSTPDLSLLESIPEKSIKVAIAEILHEGSIPKDWGGERSDLFTSNVSVDGHMMPTAFLLKGPADFSPMTIRHLGKNGDQIMRLFSEPAELLVLQHCHEVTNSVRATMRAFACDIRNPRYFAILDGYNTIRLMRAYEKCGL